MSGAKPFLSALFFAFVIAAPVSAQTAPTPTETPAPTASPTGSSVAPPWWEALWNIVRACGSVLNDSQTCADEVGKHPLLAAAMVAVFALAAIVVVLGLINTFSTQVSQILAPIKRLLPRSSPTKRYLPILLKDFRDPKYQPFTGDDVRRPRLEDVYLALDLKAEASGADVSVEDKGERTFSLSARGGDRAQLPEVLRRAKQHLALVGGAGSGKSTFLRWAALVCAKDFNRERLDDDDQRAFVYALSRKPYSALLFRGLRVLRLTRPLFPIFVSLGEFDRYCLDPYDPKDVERKLTGELPPTAEALLQFVCYRYNRLNAGLTPEYLQGQLRRGALLLFDGVDEVVFERRTRVRDAVQALLRETYVNEQTRVLLTSRPPGYDRAQWSDDFLKCDVQPMTNEQRDRLIRGWFGAVYTSADKAREKTRVLVDSLNASDERVQTMAATPLLATIFAKLQHNAFRIPDQRALLYKDAVDLILDETYRKSDTVPATISARSGDRAQRLTWLSRIAFELHQAGVGEAGLIVGDLLPRVGAASEHPALREFLHIMAQNACLLEETQPNHYGFRSHRTFQEFLAGRYLMTDFAPNDLQKLVGFVRGIAQSPNRDQWEEPLRLAVGYAAIEHDVAVRQLLGEINRAGDDEDDEAGRDWIRAITALCMSDLPETRRAALGELKQVILEAALKTLTSTNTTLNDLVIAQLGLILAATGETRVAPVLLRKFEANPPVVRRAAQRRAIGLALATLGDIRFFCDVSTGVGPAAGNEYWIPIPAGPFRMGTDDEDERALKQFGIEPWKAEKPAHTVEVSDFKIARWPVTNAEFELFMRDEGYNPEKPWWQGDGQRWRTGAHVSDLSIYDKDLRKRIEDWLKDRPVDKRDRPFFWDDPQWNAANLPVVGVTWFEAVAYCEWLNEKLEGQLPAGWRVRLPTEAEWEKAARRSPLPAGEGGDAVVAKATPHRGVRASLWPWGDEWDAERCNSEESKFNATTPVGMYPHGATADGVEDLIGNVWEWCLDAWDEKAYEKHTAKDPVIASGPARGVRGGSFLHLRSGCRSAFRYWFVPDYFDQVGGFRVCVSPIPHSAL
jgi:formylglycine-generating enzyme required for sulfatase activity